MKTKMEYQVNVKTSHHNEPAVSKKKVNKNEITQIVLS